MSLLSQCAGGTILERPKPREAKPDPMLEQRLRDRILAACLPAQR